MGKKVSCIVAIVASAAWMCNGADLNVRDLGAKGDGATKDTAAIQSAIDACAAKGGGRVVLSDGTFLSGAIQLKSGVDFHLEKGARLLASPDIADFHDWKGAKHIVAANCPRGRGDSFIFADECENIAITGEGVIDGNGETHVRRKTDPNWTGWEFERIRPMHETLPRVVFLAGCRNVRLEGVSLVNGPAGWGYWIHDCDRVTVRGLTIRSDVRYPNNDGLHVNCSRDVDISDCDIECGDDALVIRANSRSLKENKPCERVHVRDCRVRSWASGIRVGWRCDGVIRDCSFRRIAMRDTVNGIDIVLPRVLDPYDYGREPTLIEDILFEDIEMDGLYAHPLDAKIEGDPKTTLVDAVRRITLRRVHATGLELPNIRGRKDAPFRDFLFEDCSFRKVSDDVLPDWERHGAANIGRTRPARFENAEGFRLVRTEGWSLNGIWQDAAALPFDCSFTMRLGRRADKAPCATVTSASMASRAVSRDGDSIVVEWRGNEVCGPGFSTRAVFTPDGVGGWTYAFSYDGNESGLCVEEIRFPEITVPRTDKSAALYPKQSGMLRRPDWSKIPTGDTAAVAGPNTIGFKFAAILDDDIGGWYVDQRGDARLRASQFAILNAGAGKATLSSRYYPPASAALATRGELPFGGVVRPFRGGWYAAAEIYRDWVKGQDWFKRARGRDFGKLRDVALWMWNRGRADVVVPPVERFQDETGLPCALDWYWWHEIPYDVEYPKFWPPREGESAFRATVARLKDKGVYVQTYTNGMLWDRDAADWHEGGEEGRRLFRNGSEDITVFNVYLRHRMAIMCGEAPTFHSRIRGLASTLAGCGLDGLYIDMIGNGASGVCWNPAHRHEPGGGTVMPDGYRAMLKSVRAGNPRLQLSTEEEGEAYLDIVDSLIILYACHERLGKGVEPEIQMPPVFPMLYHGCVAMYGSYAVVDGITPWDEKWGVRPDIDEAKWAGKFPDQFACEFSRGVVWGLQPMVHKLLAEHQSNPKWADEWKFIKDTAAFYHANRAFLFDGEMCDPGTMRCPRKPVDFFVRGCYTKEEKFMSVHEPGLPAVFHSVWKAPDGRRSAVLVNWTREPAAYDLKTPDVSASGTLPPRTWRLVPVAGDTQAMPSPPVGANDLSTAVLEGWKASTASSSVAKKSVHLVEDALPAVWRGPGWLELPVRFDAEGKGGVAKWDVNCKADLTSRAGVEFDFWCGDISCLSQLRFYLRSGKTWFAAWPFAPDREREWCRIRFAKGDFRPEGPDKNAKLEKIDGIRVSGYRAKDGATALGIANLSGSDAVVKKLTRAELAERDAKTLAWLRTRPAPKTPEHRAFCCHSAFGMGGDPKGGWDAAAKAVRAAGFNALYPNLAWAGGAYGESAVYPQSPEMKGKGDQIKACLEACRRHGLECHIWKVFWKTGGERHADAAFLAAKRKAGLMQMTMAGDVRPDWLCPSAPENRESEIAATVELAAKGADGILYDYIRYGGTDSCYCPGCRSRFEARIGRAVAKWPQDVVSGSLADEWIKFRANCISEVVKEISDRVRKDWPHVKISAAVFPNPKSDVRAIGQDWALWCREGWIDRACPMDYTASPLLLKSMVAAQIAAAGGVSRLCPIIGPSLWPSGTDKARVAAEQIEVMRDLGLTAFSAFNLNIWTAKAVENLREGPLK